ncbi:hypothetical protein DIPPA_15685, partial [Diplonema papillatum]
MGRSGAVVGWMLAVACLLLTTSVTMLGAHSEHRENSRAAGVDPSAFEKRAAADPQATAASPKPASGHTPLPAASETPFLDPRVMAGMEDEQAGSLLAMCSAFAGGGTPEGVDPAASAAARLVPRPLQYTQVAGAGPEAPRRLLLTPAVALSVAPTGFADRRELRLSLAHAARAFECFFGFPPRGAPAAAAAATRITVSRAAAEASPEAYALHVHNATDVSITAATAAGRQSDRHVAPAR